MTKSPYGRGSPAEPREQCHVSLGLFDKSSKLFQKLCGYRYCEQQESLFTVQGILLPEMRAARDGKISSIFFHYYFILE